MNRSFRLGRFCLSVVSDNGCVTIHFNWEK